MDSRVSFIIVAFALLVTVEVFGGDSSSSSSEDSSSSGNTFDYTVNNQLVPPYFNNTITLDVKNANTKLFYYMVQAVETNSIEFTGFKATYFRQLGYFITSINNRSNDGDSGYFWRILNSDGFLPLGVSSYIPTKNEAIMFNFSVYIAGDH